MLASKGCVGTSSLPTSDDSAGYWRAKGAWLQVDDVGWGFTCERQACMTIRSRREIVTFRRPFRIRNTERLLPAGAYEVVTDEETIEGLTLPVYRRIATTIIVPPKGPAAPWRCCQ